MGRDNRGVFGNALPSSGSRSAILPVKGVIRRVSETRSSRKFAVYLTAQRVGAGLLSGASTYSGSYSTATPDPLLMYTSV